MLIGWEREREESVCNPERKNPRYDVEDKEGNTVFSIGLCVRCVDYWACWQNNPWRDTDDNQRESILTGEITYWSANIHPPQGRVTSFLFAADYSEAASKFSATTHASDDPGLLRLGVRRVFTCYGNDCGQASRHSRVFGQISRHRNSTTPIYWYLW